MAYETAASNRNSVISATSSSDVFDDARSHADDDSFATPTVESRPETPRPDPPRPETPRQQVAASDEEATPHRTLTQIKARPADTLPTTESRLPEETPVSQRTAAATQIADRETTPEEDEKIPSIPTPASSTEKAKDESLTESQEGSKPSSQIEDPSTGAVRSSESAEKPKVEDAAQTAKDNAETPIEDDANFVTGVKLILLTVGLFLATFVIALDNTIIATAIPKITTEFDSINDVGWYGSSYLLTTTSLQPSFGKIYSYFNVKWTYVAALVIFEIGSVVCATAPNSNALIVGRAVAGVGAAALFSGGMTIIGFSVPLRNRAFYIAVLSSTFGIASIVGPILGGVFTDSPKLTWRFCFWINLPVGGLAILAVAIFFSSPKRKASELTALQKFRKMDFGGASVLICAVVCLLLALQWGGTTYPWHDSKVWGCLLGFGLLLILFISLQLWIGEDATIPIRIISKRPVAVGAVFVFFLSVSLFAHIYYLPFYFQAVKGTSAEGSGIHTIPYLVSNTVMSIIVGAAVTTFGPYTPFLWGGSAVFTVGAGMLYLLKVDSSSSAWIGYQLLAGFGAGAAIQIPFISVQAVLEAADMPTGNALTIFFNTLGGALSVSICQNIFSNELLERLQATIPPEIIEIVSKAGATGVQSATPPQYLSAVLQDYNDAVTRAFIVPIAAGTCAFIASLFMPWGSVKGKNLLAGGAA